MVDLKNICRAFNNVIHNNIKILNVNEEEIRLAVQSVVYLYKEQSDWNALSLPLADYTYMLYRCAYLHKYAAFHTAMVYDVLCSALRENFNVFKKLVYLEDQFKVCSLGGGPGSDVIGVLAALHYFFPGLNTNADIVDFIPQWSSTFEEILHELITDNNGDFGAAMDRLRWQYFAADLLKPFEPNVGRAISSAALVTMIKFVSAAACQDTISMLQVKLFCHFVLQTGAPSVL